MSEISDLEEADKNFEKSKCGRFKIFDLRYCFSLKIFFSLKILTKS